MTCLLRRGALIAFALFTVACTDDNAVVPSATTGPSGGDNDASLVGGDGTGGATDAATGTDDAAGPADTTIVLPDGAVVQVDVPVFPDDATIVLPDGAVVSPDGGAQPDATVLPDGAVVGPDVQPCVASPEVCNGLDDDCNGAIDDGVLCNDAQPCTVDQCAGGAGCQHLPAPFATACDLDGDACTADHCLGGKCEAGSQPQCSDGDPCTTDACNAANGTCTHTPTSGPCEDGNPCTVGDTCQGGCVPGAVKVCTDGNACTIDNCDAGSGLCTFTAFQNGVSCDDGTKCTISDKCAGGVCQGKALDCDDGIVCTDDTCDPGQGCQHPPIDGIKCDDGLPCTIGDVCAGGLCKSNGTLGCDDGNPCTIDACASQGGCQHTNSLGACNDGTFCTTGDSCATGVCVGQVVSCDDANPCTTDSCSPTTGCVFLDNNVPCNDGNACTTGEACTGGVCVPGTALSCTDGIACTTDTCDPTTGGCSHAPQKALCDDGEVCTLDQCLTATGCVHDKIPQCCGGKQCASDETCITYPDNLVPFCAKACNTGDDCPGSCCYMSYKTKHCLVDPYLAECCGTKEYWATDSDPYACGVGGKGECLNFPNKVGPPFPSTTTACVNPCTTNADCPGTCCATTTMGSQTCVAPGYTQFYCP